MSSISSSNLSMSSLIFLPFLATSGLADAPSPLSEGLLGRVSLRFCSAITPSVGYRTWSASLGPYTILTDEGVACNVVPGPSVGSAEVLAQGQGLVLVRQCQPGAVHSFGGTAQPLEPHLEKGLAVVDEKRHFPGPHLHHHPGPEHAAIAEAESRVEEARVVGANLARPGVVDHHLRRVRGGDPDALPGDEDMKAVRLEDERVASRALDRLPEVLGVVVADPGEIHQGRVGMRAVADEAVCQTSGEVDAHAQPPAQGHLAQGQGSVVVVQEGRGPVEPAEGAVGDRG